ncbi:hypothetical protein C1646_775529 [Rhizophagus diaphanus]|nr:hypothetical protein C1646_775529 [Rhizophagus diaphanus] [Rhizophagus sp. MUCL 43196]
MVPPIRNVTVHRKLIPITCTTKPYRSNIHRELMPITHTTEPYRSNVRTAEPYRRELMLIIHESYSSNWTRDRRKGKNLVRDSEDEMEVDEEEARAEMKMILKTFPIELELKYDEKFTSESNDEILRQVIPRLIEAMKPSDNRYHSPEYSESDEKQPDSKRQINLIDLLQNVLDQYAFSLQSAQLIRTQNYADEIYNIVFRHSRGAPNWTYIEQNTPANTDFSEPKMPIQTEKNLIMVEDVEVLVKMDEIAVIEDSEWKNRNQREWKNR